MKIIKAQLKELEKILKRQQKSSQKAEVMDLEMYKTNIIDDIITKLNNLLY